MSKVLQCHLILAPPTLPSPRPTIWFQSPIINSRVRTLVEIECVEISLYNLEFVYTTSFVIFLETDSPNMFFYQETSFGLVLTDTHFFIIKKYQIFIYNVVHMIVHWIDRFMYFLVFDCDFPLNTMWLIKVLNLTCSKYFNINQWECSVLKIQRI